MLHQQVLAAAAVLGLVATLLSVGKAGADEPVTKNLFRNTAKGLEFVSDGWSVRSDGDRGWVSLKVGQAEFLDSTAARGAFAFQKGDRWFTAFPDRQNLSHDDQVGRIGHAADGINLVKISPAWHRPEFEVYLGANEKEDQKVLLFLGSDVAFVRVGGFLDTSRTGAQTVLALGDKRQARTREALVVHRTGTALLVKSLASAKGPKGEDLPPPEFEVGAMKDPGGQERLAIAFPCKGFAANTYQVAVETVPRAENFVLCPRFDVKSSDDLADGNAFGGATNGVGNPVYGRDTKLDFGIVFGWLAETPFRGTAELEIVDCLGRPHFSQKIDLKDAAPPADAKGVATRQIRVRFDPKFHLPGVSEVWGRLIDAEGRLVWVGRYRMAYDWEHYEPAIQVEPDFKEFWDKTLAELRAAPLEPQAERVKAYEDHPQFEIYDVTFNGWRRQRLHAMLFVPKAPAKPLPAIVTAHPGTTGFGVNKRPDGTYGSEHVQDPRFVTIVPLIRGHAPDAKDIPFNHPWWGPLGDRDTYAARSWYSAMVRAIDYLAARPDLVDMKRIVASGGSQGGALALVTAALDPRVAVCLSDCPACCQPQEIMESYGSFGPSRGQVPPGRTLQDVEKMLSYYNPVNFCPSIRCPTYVGSNIGDLTVHSLGPLAAYRNLTGLAPGEKAFYPGFSHAHGSGPGLGLKSREWLEKLGGPPATAGAH